MTHYDCLPILMLLYIMLYIMLAYLMLFAPLSNAVCLYNAFFCLFLPLIFANVFFPCFVLVYRHIVCLFHVLFCIMHSALICWFFVILCPHRFLFFNERAMCSLEK